MIDEPWVKFSRSIGCFSMSETGARAYLRINASTREDRIEMTSRVARAIADMGGWVLDFKQFSNVSICINFEIPAKNIGKLHLSIEAMNLRLSRESDESLYRQGRLDNGPDAVPGETVPGTLQITFIHDDPDLRRDVPAIPG
jgi:hypothetical protein